MKLTAAFCTLALATAQDSESQGAQGGGGYGEQAEAAPQESYGNEAAPQESYGEEAHYAQAPAIFVRHVKACFQGCPDHAPCMGGGGCQPTACGEEAHYGAQQSYGGAAQQSGYRRLADDSQGAQGESDNSYGYEAPAQAAPEASYAAPAPVTYAQAAPEYHQAEPTCNECPAGTVDTRHLGLQNNIILWIAFALLFLPSMFFLCRAFEVIQAGANSNATPAMIEAMITVPRVIAGVVCLIASLAYLTMATGHGYIVKCNGRSFYYARYVDWAITTPLMLWDLCTFGGATSLTRTFLVVMDVFMIVAGLIGELIDGGERWAFFGFSMLAFIPIMWFLCKLENDDGVCCGAAANLSPQGKLFQRVLLITIITWSMYPIVWILATSGGQTAAVGAAAYGAPAAAAAGGYRALQSGGFTAVGIISVDAETMIYTVLDVIAKSVFGGVIVCWDWNEWLELIVVELVVPVPVNSML